MTLPLEGVRIADFTWLVAGAWGPRQLASLGAEVIRIEWKGRLDVTRFGSGTDLNVNTGKRALGLNMKHPDGMRIARELIAKSDAVMENFTAGTLESWGLGYEELKRIKEDIIYVQVAGYGTFGPYSEYRAYGLINQAFSGLTYQVGLPEPEQPCGWGFGYMDAMIGHLNACAFMAALHYRDQTGKGQHIDMAQSETGTCLTGLAYLDKQINGRNYQRSGNRSPYLPAAPHGVYRCAGQDEWIAITCFSDEQWRALCRALGRSDWADDERFSSLANRLQNQDELDSQLEGLTIQYGKHPLMHLLQSVDVPAGAVQSAQEIVEYDAALADCGYLAWLPHPSLPDREVRPVEQFAGRMSETPGDAGGPLHRGSPAYDEDTEYVLGDILGYSADEIRGFRDAGCI